MRYHYPMMTEQMLFKFLLDMIERDSEQLKALDRELAYLERYGEAAYRDYD